MAAHFRRCLYIMQCSRVLDRALEQKLPRASQPGVPGAGGKLPPGQSVSQERSRAVQVWCAHDKMRCCNFRAFDVSAVLVLTLASRDRAGARDSAGCHVCPAVPRHCQRNCDRAC